MFMFYIFSWFGVFLIGLPYVLDVQLVWDILDVLNCYAFGLGYSGCTGLEQYDDYVLVCDVLNCSA